MSQITRGIRATLSHPRIYDAFQRLMDDGVARDDFMRNVVKAGAGARILDLGCGTAQILEFLPPTVDYWGYDISPEYIAAAERRFNDRGHFACETLTASAAGRMPPFDIVIASGVLHHLDDETAAAFMGVVRTALRAGGRFASIDPVLVPGQNPIARLLISRDRGQNVRGPEGYLGIVRPVATRVDGTLRHRSWVPYTHWMMEGTFSAAG